MNTNVDQLILAAVIAGLSAGALQGSDAPVTADAALGLRWKYQYDDQGRLERLSDPGGKDTFLDYEVYHDEQEQLKSVTRRFEGGEVVYEFDRQGQFISMKDLAGSVAYGYDDLGRLNHVQRQGTHAIAYTHDSLDRITSIQVGDFYRIDYSYDFLGRLASMMTPAGAVTYEYLPGQSKVVRSLPNGVKTFWEYQLNGQLAKITHGFFEKPDDTTYTLLAEYEYAHEPDGRIATIGERVGRDESVKRYSYDNMGRLIGATDSGGIQYEYTYDLVGNRLKATVTDRPDQILDYDWAGRLTSVDGTPCAYDASGNLTDLTLEGVARQYRYHPDGRLAEVRLGSETVHYRYDGFGRLVVRKAARGETLFFPDPLSGYWQPLVIEESDGGRTLVIWEGSMPLATVRNDEVEWLLHDHLGSVRLVTGVGGGVIRQCEFDPFGVWVEAPEPTTVKPGFTGLFWDAQAQTYITLARVCGPVVGGFFQPDPQKRLPTESTSDTSRYLYCGADPVNMADRDGAAPESINSGQIWWDAYWADVGDHLWDATRAEETLATYSDSHVANARGSGVAAGATATALDILGTTVTPISWGQDESKRLQRYWTFSSREEVVEQIVDQAWEKARSHVGNEGSVGDVANQFASILLAWRKNEQLYLQEFPTALAPTDQEWQLSENYAHKIKYGVTGATLNSMVRVPKTSPGWQSIVVGEVMGRLWSLAHFVGERGSIPPSTFQNLAARKPVESWSTPESPNDIWEPQTFQTHKWHVRGTMKAMELLLAQDRGARIGKQRPTLTGMQEMQLAVDQPRPPRRRRDEVYDDTRKYYWWGGGGGPPGGGGASALSPSRVGGVCLSGAGGSIEGLGVLKGLRIDANNNVVLVAEDAGDIMLPPLRLDDLVTVFRSVYLHGEGPTVTIDPDPENPEKSAMIIKHSKATEDTYVGWILYQADRLMKSYTQGVDNKTEEDVVSSVPGYSNVVETIYFGGEDPRKAQKEGSWERFWIVPAEANRFEGPRRELTLFDVPLKVKTQKMKWVKDELVDDFTGESSPGAMAFTSWFTTNYNGIAVEQYLLPPPECGITNLVPVFTELRRIALMTVIAEKLRDQGVPMPFWMRFYEVPDVPFERRTPGMEVTRTRRDGNSVQTARIFGGVTLSPESKAVKTYATAADVAKAPPAVRAKLNRSIKLAQDLESVVAEQIPPIESTPLKLHRFTQDNRAFQAVSVPGAKTLALSPCRLNEVDLVVPFGGGREIRLVRSFNSFFDPKGPWGRGWTMNLPRLDEIRIPGDREDGKVTYMTGYELITRLNSVYARFKDVRPVDELGGSRLQVPDEEGPFFGLADGKLDVMNDLATRVVLLKDGGEWHFSEYGQLIAIKEGPQITVYERGSDGRTPRILGLLGGALAARIDLEYTSEGVLRKVVGKSLDRQDNQVNEVSYAYDDSGRLASLNSTDGTVGYSYKDSLVASVTWTDNREGAKPEVLHTFDYNDRGQLVSEKRGERSIRHTVAAVPGGVEAVVREGLEEQAGQRVRYDDQMRPVESREADGTQTSWAYESDGSVEMTVATLDDRKVTVADSADGRKRTVSAGGSPTIEAGYDAGGNLTTLNVGGQVLLEQEWRRDGQLAKAQTDWQAISPQYSEQGLLTAIRVQPPKAGEGSAWQDTRVDRRGAPVGVKDNTGLDLQLAYDDSGAVASAIQKTPEGNLGFQVQRDASGRVEAVDSSWGKLNCTYSEDKDLKKVTASRGDRNALLELDKGKILRRVDFDGGETRFSYYSEGELGGLLKEVKLPNGLPLSHNYDRSGGLSSVKVGELRRVKLARDEQGRITEYAWEPVTR